MVVGRRICLIVGALLATSALVACGGAGGGAESEGAGTTTAETGAPAELAAPVSVQEYQELLTRATAPLPAAFESVEKARKQGALAQRLGRAEKVVAKAAASLAEVTPPEDVAGAHAELVKGLQGLTGALEKAGAAVEARSLCVASSVMARLGEARAAPGLRAAVKALRDKGYEVEKLVPRAVPMANRRLASGELLVPVEGYGPGGLTIENGLGRDAVALLVEGKRTVASVYVRRESQAEIRGIPDGTYRLFFTIGNDWDAKLDRFTRMCEFKRFDDEFVFESAGYTITSWSVTLHPVVGGGAASSEVDPDEFPG